MIVLKRRERIAIGYEEVMISGDGQLFVRLDGSRCLINVIRKVGFPH